MFGTKLKVAARMLAGAEVSGGPAFAAIPAADGSITACYTKQAGLFDPKGAVRLVDSPSQCRPNESAASWNQQGQPGPAGSAGPAGPEGLSNTTAVNPDLVSLPVTSAQPVDAELYCVQTRNATTAYVEESRLYAVKVGAVDAR